MFPGKTNQTQKKKTQPSISLCSASALGFWHFTQPAPHYAAKISFTRPEVSKVSLHICSLETTPTPPPPPHPHLLSRHEPACSAGVGWSHDRVRYVTTPRPLTTALMDPSVCLAWVSYFFYTYIYKNREVCTRTVITAALYMPLFWHPHSFFHRLTHYLPPNYL